MKCSVCGVRAHQSPLLTVMHMHNSRYVEGCPPETLLIEALCFLCFGWWAVFMDGESFMYEVRQAHDRLRELMPLVPA